MIWLWCALALAAPFRFERVDVLSEDSPTWLADELPRLGASPRFAGVRFVEQVGVVWGVGDRGLSVSTALRTQGVHYEERVVDGPVGVYAGGGLITRLGFPAGVRAGLAVRRGPVRIGGSVVLLSSATWARPRMDAWRVLPGVGIGFGRAAQAPVTEP